MVSFVSIKPASVKCASPSRRAATRPSSAGRALSPATRWNAVPPWPALQRCGPPYLAALLLSASSGNKRTTSAARRAAIGCADHDVGVRPSRAQERGLSVVERTTAYAWELPFHRVGAGLFFCRWLRKLAARP